MSEEDLRSISIKLMHLQKYVHKIPTKVMVIGLRNSVDAADRLLPDGVHFDHVIHNLHKHLPLAIDDELRNLETHCSKLCDPYAKHILAEIATILTLLQNFRAAHTYTPQTLTTIHLLLDQLHMLQ